MGMGRRSTKGWHLHRRHQKGCAKGQIQQPKTKRGLLTQKPRCLGDPTPLLPPPEACRGSPVPSWPCPAPSFAILALKHALSPHSFLLSPPSARVSLCPAPKSLCTDHLLKTARQILCQYEAEFNTQTCRSNWGFLSKGQGESVRAGGKLLRGIWLDSEGGGILAKGAWQDALENEALRPKSKPRSRPVQRRAPRSRTKAGLGAGSPSPLRSPLSPGCPPSTATLSSSTQLDPIPSRLQCPRHAPTPVLRITHRLLGQWATQGQSAGPRESWKT